MRRLAALAVVIASLALQGCGVHSCQALGDRLCQCSGAGSTRDACKTEVKNQLSAVGLKGDNYAACQAALDSCNAPADVSFCEWINTSCGKASCGLSYDPVATACLP